MVCLFCKRKHRVQKFLKATSILPEEAEAFRQAIQRETIVAGVVIQWKIVVCLANGTAELQSRLLSAIATFPEADIVVLVANGFAITEQQVNHLSKPTQEIFHGKLLFESATQAEPPEQALVRIWDLLPVGVKLVAFCIKECEVRQQRVCLSNLLSNHPEIAVIQVRNTL